ncbi:Beta-1,3-galactosyltransferase pvg3 [Schizosaccharomyces pombe]
MFSNSKKKIFLYVLIAGVATFSFAFLVLNRLQAEEHSLAYVENLFLDPFIKQNESLAHANDRPFKLYLGIFSQAKNVDRRNFLRTDYNEYIKEFAVNDTVDVRFILGLPENEQELATIREEQRTYGDLAVLPIPENVDAGKSIVYFQTFLEGYQPFPLFSELADNLIMPSTQFHGSFIYNQSIKTYELPGMKEFQDLGEPKHDYDFIVKADDDSFLNLPRLFEMLKEHVGKSRFYFGRDCTRRELPTAVRDFPYMCGFFYIVSPDMAYEVAKRRNIIIPFEDAQTGYSIYLSGNVKNAEFSKCTMYDLILPNEGFNYRQSYLRIDAIAVHKLKSIPLLSTVSNWFKKMYEHRANCSALIETERLSCLQATIPLPSLDV